MTTGLWHGCKKGAATGITSVHGLPLEPEREAATVIHYTLELAN